MIKVIAGFKGITKLLIQYCKCKQVPQLGFVCFVILIILVKFDFVGCDHNSVADLNFCHYTLLFA